MSLLDLVAHRSRVLTEGSVYELLRRNPRVRFDPSIAHAGLIYEPVTRGLLEEVHRRYLEIGRRHGLPMLLFTDTWRASEERVSRSQFRGREVNADNVAFMRELASASGTTAFIAGMSGTRGDAYSPAEAPDRAEAARIHAPQIEELARAGVDALFAATLPSLGEALGIADVMARTGVPWMLSFVVRPDGTLLDGSRLADALHRLDDEIVPNALGFSINCVHPTVALSALQTLDPDSAGRVIAFQGNTSTLPPEELDGHAELQGEDPATFAASMSEVALRVRIVGGCCGTDERHVEAVASLFTQGRTAI
ncbi:MAG TPA: homocysteine S-methyltransferase family protein [Thermoanaerobaculia bacterium]